jgi:hypothetical protein
LIIISDVVLRREGKVGKDHDGGDAAHEDEAAAGLHVLVCLLGDEELAFDVDGKDPVDLGAGGLVKVGEVLDAGVAL